MLKQLNFGDNCVYLIPGNLLCKTLKVFKGSGLIVEGVVTFMVKSC